MKANDVTGCRDRIKELNVCTDVLEVDSVGNEKALGRRQ